MEQTHGVLNIIGWGTLLPIGAIVARSFRKSPLKCDEWYNLHVVCQTLGYIIGAVGWSIGMWLGNSSKQYSLRAHRILGIIIFTSATAQASPRFTIPCNYFDQSCFIDLWCHCFCNADVCSLLATKERKWKKEMVEDMP